MECLDPPLQEVPVDEWFCPECTVPGVDPTHGNVLSSLSCRALGVFLSSVLEKDLVENLDLLCGKNFHQGEGFL
jgi:hypothetical protein